MRPFHRSAPVLAAGALALSALGALAGSAPASANHAGTGVRLFAPNHHLVMTIHNSGQDEWVEFNPAFYLESTEHALNIAVSRKDASHPIRAVVHIGDRTRTLPRALVKNWNGLSKAFTITWTTPEGTLIKRSSPDWCPNEGQESRLNPDAAADSLFTYTCSNHPFTRGERWGIDRGWSRQIFAYGFDTPTITGSSAIMEVTLRHGLARAFGISDADSTLRFNVAVKHVTDPIDPCGPDCGPVPGPVVDTGSTPTGASSSSARTAPSAPRTQHRHYPRSVLPDLVALPAFGISTHREDGKDLLDFAATVFNGGRGPLVAEGFRRGGKPVMDAYQFFYRNDKQIGSAKVGTMEYDARPSHQHWHFHDFAVYDLVNANQHRLRTSGKEAFCLAPTDAIDLLVPGAVVNPGNGDLSTACGDVTSIWVREVLASGWGDTYTQQRAGQSINISGLPNGTYWIRVTANPVHRLQEATRKNNVSLRRVILGGTEGHRTVSVPKYGLIDSEKGYFGEF